MYRILEANGGDFLIGVVLGSALMLALLLIHDRIRGY
jgi:hypothetical protein